MTQHAAVLGSPIGHSLSPTLHRAAYAAAGLTGWVYTAHTVDEGGLAPFIQGLDETWQGLSLTMPLKVAAFDIATEVTDLARESRAINTLQRTPDGWRGDNTDVRGIVAAVRDAGMPHVQHAIIIGAGATARSALLAMRALGAESALVVARNQTKAAQLAATITGLRVEVGSLDGWSHGAAPVVVSTVPGGAANEAAAGALAQGSAFGPEQLLLDVVYADWPTPLAQAAHAHGMQVVSGIEMLIHQAARQFEIFTGCAAPIAAMQHAGRSALGHTPDA